MGHDPQRQTFRTRGDAPKVNCYHLARSLIQRVINQCDAIRPFDRRYEMAHTTPVAAAGILLGHGMSATSDPLRDAVYRRLHIVDADIDEMNNVALLPCLFHQPQSRFSSKRCLDSKAGAASQIRPLLSNHLPPCWDSG